MPAKKDKPITRKEEIARHPDNKIDEDFKGYPNGPAKDRVIKPVTSEEEKTAGLDNKDGEKRIIQPDERKGLDEQESDGSANAFEGK
ncbi:MAG TPA: hypothetical protein VGO58_07130 [Chitinophagaceae bacterium]|jgi:hypothetical protein|nr:hypothetical protein [Chitinophagaceae bacterium]